MIKTPICKETDLDPKPSFTTTRYGSSYPGPEFVDEILEDVHLLVTNVMEGYGSLAAAVKS